MDNTQDKYAHIKGWGIDADPKNDPTYPMKTRTGQEHDGYSWQRPTQQKVDIEVHHSVERPNLSAVFGTSVPPSGISGMIRRLAYKRTENQYSRWLPLMLADRVNMVEGVVQDLLHGHVPNIIDEKGLKSDWKYNRPKLLGKLAVGAALALGAAACVSKHKGRLRARRRVRIRI